LRLSRRATALRRVGLGEIIGVIVLVKRTVKRLFEDGFRLVDLELALQIPHVMRDGAAVGTTSGIGEAKVLVGNVVIIGAPVVD
jgi:hypothetical protein